MRINIIEKKQKAVVKFKHPSEIDWFKKMMASIRDSNPQTHPPISLKDETGQIRFMPPKPMPQPQNIETKPIMVKKEELEKNANKEGGTK